mmetsp:Transcript_37581/g.94890  ORF Transcript_37581/g.94890 Transcript_37581/m.94890 type:complete len:238 (-) Transcript_37581:1668-2381(-)
MALHQQRVLLVPPLVQRLLLRRQRLVALHLGHDLGLVLRVQRRQLRGRALLARLELLLVFHLLLVLLAQQRLELLAVRLQLARELLGQLLDALLQVQVLEPQLVLGLHRQLRHLLLQLRHARALLVQLAARHQHLARPLHALLLPARRRLGIAVAHVVHVHGAVLRRGGHQLLVPRHAQARDGRSVRLELRELARQRELVGAQLPALRGRHHDLGARQQADLRQRHARIDLLGDLCT